MVSTFALRRCAAVKAFGALACLSLCASASAQTRLRAHYTISMTGVPFGQITWLATIGDQRYSTSAIGNASGVLSVLVNGEGAVDVRGVVTHDGHLTPRAFTSKVVDDEGSADLRMTFEEGIVKELISTVPPPPPAPNRLPVSDADRRGVVDPLSAMLLPAGEDVMAPASCDRLLPIFDGRRRYDLALSYKRIDKLAIDHSYSGAVLVCGVVLHPIAGYRTDSMLAKYVAGRRDMELWFAPVSGAPNGVPVLAPIRILVPTVIGTLGIEADQFDAVPTPAPAALPR